MKQARYFYEGGGSVSGEITRRRNGADKQVRPTWAYTGTDNCSQQLEMLESIRNVLESIQASQMLQCDVRSAIMAMKYDAERVRKILDRIDRRLAKVEKLK